MRTSTEQVKTKKNFMGILSNEKRIYELVLHEERSYTARKAALTRKRRRAARKAVVTRVRRAAARKAWVTRRANAA